MFFLADLINLSRCVKILPRGCSNVYMGMSLGSINIPNLLCQKVADDLFTVKKKMRRNL